MPKLRVIFAQNKLTENLTINLSFILSLIKTEYRYVNLSKYDINDISIISSEIEIAVELCPIQIYNNMLKDKIVQSINLFDQAFEYK